MDAESLKCIIFGFCEYTWKHTFLWIHFIKTLGKGEKPKSFRLTSRCVSAQNILVLLKKKNLWQNQTQNQKGKG